ncbi:MAG: hypothetical protein ABIK09_01415 [Pseudomonadota bacterium]
MRRLILGLIIAVCVSLAAPAAMAQNHKDGQKKHKKLKKGKKPLPPPAEEKPSSEFGLKGTWTLGGVGALRTDWMKAEDADDWKGPVTFAVAPMLGYFVVDGFELRLGPEFRYINTPANYHIGGGAKLGGFYHHLLQGTLFFSAGAEVSLGGGKTKTEGADASSSDFLWALGPRLGLTLAFGGRFGGFVQLLSFFDYGGISRTSQVGSLEGDTSIDLMNFGLQTALGIFF